MAGFGERVRRQPAWIALGIFVLLCLWIASGSLSADEDGASKEAQMAPVPKVRVTRMQAEQVNREVTLYGRTEPNRIATLRSEIKGQVTDIYVKEGQYVSAGEKLIAIDDNDLKQRLTSAKATLKQREIELKGARSLGKQGYQSESALASATANLEAAKAQVENLQLAIENTVIVAPFDGMVNERMVEVGDLLRDGDRIATVVDLNPLVITANVTENHIRNLSVGQNAEGRMVSGQMLTGNIRYISSVSETGTNTFKIEVEVENGDYAYLAGMSTELSIPLEQAWAVKITPAVMALDEQGNLGVKTVKDEHVEFIPIDIIKSDSQGVWLAGMGQQADVITLGHGYVKHGDRVDVTMEQ